MRDGEEFAEAALAEANRLRDVTDGLRELLLAAAAADRLAASPPSAPAEGDPD